MPIRSAAVRAGETPYCSDFTVKEKPAERHPPLKAEKLYFLHLVNYLFVAIIETDNMQTRN
jgi:hypothetical protein